MTVAGAPWIAHALLGVTPLGLKPSLEARLRR
jgi:hypothetical protein